MSGGTFDYRDRYLGAIALIISNRAENSTQRAFGGLVADIAKALHDLDRHFAGDTFDSEPESVLRLLSKERRIEQAVADGKAVIEELKKLIGE